MKRLITSVGSTLLLAALVIGSPTALLAWGRLDGLARLSPSALMSPDDGTIVLGLVTITGWAAWFVFTLSVVIEAVALATHSRVHVTLPGLSLVQGLAAGLLVASLAILAPAARGNCPTQQNITVATVGIAQQTRDDTTVQEGVPGLSGTGASVSRKLRGSQNRPMEFTEPDSARASGPARKMTAEPGYDMYRISATDDLWSLAERVYGEGTAWHQIARANSGMDVQHLPVGDQIKLPRAGMHGLGTYDPAAPGADTLDAGTTFSDSISTTSAPAAATWNLPNTGTTVDPAHGAGDLSGTDSAATGGATAEAASPSTDSAAALSSDSSPSHPSTTKVVVHRGDTLSKLAREHLGDADAWPQIWQLNRDLVTDPDVIDVGWQLTVPCTSQEHASGQDAGTAHRTARHDGGRTHESAVSRTTASEGAESARPARPEASHGPRDEMDSATTAPGTRAPTPLVPTPGGVGGTSADRETSSTDAGTRIPLAPGVPSQTGSAGAQGATASSAAEVGSSPRPTAGVSGDTPATAASRAVGSDPTGGLPRDGDGTGADSELLVRALSGMSLFLAGGISGALVSRRRQQLFSRKVGRRIPAVPEERQRTKQLLDAAGAVGSDGAGTTGETAADSWASAEARGPVIVPEDQISMSIDPTSEVTDTPDAPWHARTTAASELIRSMTEGLEEPDDTTEPEHASDVRDGNVDDDPGTEALQHDDMAEHEVSDGEVSRSSNGALPGQLSGSTGDELTATTVVLGQRLDGTPMLMDLADSPGLVTVEGPDRPCQSLVAAIGLCLVASRWSSGVDVIVVGESLRWLAQIGIEDVQPMTTDEVSRALQWWTSRAHPHSHDMAAPEVVRVILADEPIDVDDVAAVRAAGMVLVQLGSASGGLVIHVAERAGRERPGVAERTRPGASQLVGQMGRTTFEVQGVDRPMRRAIVDLVELTGQQADEPAPWWDGGTAHGSPGPDGLTPDSSGEVLDNDESGGDPPRTALLQPSHNMDEPPDREPARTRRPEPITGKVLLEDTMTTNPSSSAGPSPVLRLLGPVDLVGARGQIPSKARRQCLEYAAWILAHPGARSTQMSDSLLVAETTRRSNLSRLRRWLGNDDSGEPYLADAYDGRLRLCDEITTDWEHLEVLIAAGVARATDAALAGALDLVRGAPLADAAPGQWLWAEEWRLEMVQTIRDIGAELARRRMAEGDLDGARRAVNRALSACPQDEVLLTTQIRIAHLADDRCETERLVYLLARQARRIGVDLSDETVTVLQEVMEGRPRTRVV
ncbi:LysM peptidoglycan-binding domain-containing protein [Cutibacterium granulosum]|uniref:Uncharacterized protein n=1 Tax=Cutibacterium granulosum TM11 TaxID=1292373 RepID=A0ACB4UQD0_9ACTN|nr:hypothetical protein H640_02278 [Cutibacterium granulosum TM11]